MTRTKKMKRRRTETTSRRSFANQMIRSDGAATLRRSLETKMDEKFIIVWTIDGETTNIPHSTQDAALYQAEKLLRKHGCDLEITLHLDDEISSPPSIWFNRKRMRQWCLAGFPAVRI